MTSKNEALLITIPLTLTRLVFTLIFCFCLAVCMSKIISYLIGRTNKEISADSYNELTMMSTNDPAVQLLIKSAMGNDGKVSNDEFVSIKDGAANIAISGKIAKNNAETTQAKVRLLATIKEGGLQ